MFCVEEEYSRRRSYNSYMCVSVEDLDCIYELIRSAITNPAFLLCRSSVNKSESSHQSNGRFGNTYPFVPEPNLPAAMCTTNDDYTQTRHGNVLEDSEDSHQPLTVHSAQTTFTEGRKSTSTGRLHRPLEIWKEIKPRPYSRNQFAAPGRTLSSPDFFIPRSRLMEGASPTAQNSLILSPPISEKECNHPISYLRSVSAKPAKEEIIKNVTFIDNSSRNGPKVADRGSVYLYVARSKHLDSFSDRERERERDSEDDFM
ncbi:unnamed protein product [Dicrocoelium dendriticum]|nr:unnamed protein product [Dicrocoelium dendriticum]